LYTSKVNIDRQIGQVIVEVEGKKQLHCSENALVTPRENCMQLHLLTKGGLQPTGSTK
jgi:hypothetical protein